MAGIVGCDNARAARRARRAPPLRRDRDDPKRDDSERDDSESDDSEKRLPVPTRRSTAARRLRAALLAAYPHHPPSPPERGLP